MLRVPIAERSYWRDRAKEYGFGFHTMFGQTYWDESAYYQFRLEQIERDLEDPTAELHQMCLEVVDRVVKSEEWLERFRIPEPFWDAVRQSWQNAEPSLYSRLDLAYDGQSPAKLYENNADTPTSLYETGFWQWLWLEDNLRDGRLKQGADQFNSLQEKLIERFAELARQKPDWMLHLSCSKGSDEDRGTVEYIGDCAAEAGIHTEFVHIEDIGHGEGDVLVDLDNQVIQWMFKLYPWEYLLREDYAPLLLKAPTRWIEPLWKAVLSNKAILPALWQLFPNHPNLLPAYFTEEEARKHLREYVRKPIFSREGAGISVIRDGQEVMSSPGPYGEEGYVYQAWHPLPKFGNSHTLIGSWLVNDQPAGISIREDQGPITQDLSRFLPHIILG